MRGGRTDSEVPARHAPAEEALFLKDNKLKKKFTAKEKKEIFINQLTPKKTFTVGVCSININLAF